MSIGIQQGINEFLMSCNGSAEVNYKGIASEPSWCNNENNKDCGGLAGA